MKRISRIPAFGVSADLDPNGSNERTHTETLLKSDPACLFRFEPHLPLRVQPQQGGLFLTEKAIYIESNGVVLSIEYGAVSVHALYRATNAAEKSYIYCQLSDKTIEDEQGDRTLNIGFPESQGDVDHDDVPEAFLELSITPSIEIDEIFQVLSERICAHPDPFAEVSEPGDIEELSNIGMEMQDMFSGYQAPESFAAADPSTVLYKKPRLEQFEDPEM